MLTYSWTRTEQDPNFAAVGVNSAVSLPLAEESELEALKALTQTEDRKTLEQYYKYI